MAHNAPATRSSIRSRNTAPYFLRPRARPAPHSRVGQTLESLAPGGVTQVNPKTCCLAGQALESEARGRVPQRNPNNRCFAVQTIESEARGRAPQRNPITAASWYRLLSQRLGVGSLKPTLFFGLGNREVSFALAALGSFPLHNPPAHQPKVRLSHGIVSHSTQ